MGGNEGRDRYRKCPHCGSRDIYAERAHGDTICRDCGWYTEQGNPGEPVDWRALHTDTDHNGGGA